MQNNMTPIFLLFVSKFNFCFHGNIIGQYVNNTFKSVFPYVLFKLDYFGSCNLQYEKKTGCASVRAVGSPTPDSEMPSVSLLMIFLHVKEEDYMYSKVFTKRLGMVSSGIRQHPLPEC